MAIKSIDLSKYESGQIFSPLQKELIEVLEENGPMNRRELVEETGAARTTIYDNLMGLAKHNLVKKYPRPRNSRGRPPIYFRLVDQNKVAQEA